MAEVDYAIKTDSIIKVFGKRAAVQGVDLRVPRGATYGLIGLNGAGKSTLLRMVMGLLGQTSGSRFIAGIDVDREPMKAKMRVGYVPDRPTAYPWMRVGEVVQFCRSVHRGSGGKWNDELVRGVLQRGRIDLKQRVGKLSKGQGARLMLGLALGHEPEILILDEPTDGLDPIAREEFVESVLEGVVDQNRTVLMSSHGLGDVQRVADYVGVMHEGKMLVQCPVEELVLTTKRVRMVLDLAESTEKRLKIMPKAPASAVWSRVEGREWIVTVRDFTAESVEMMKAAVGGAGGASGGTAMSVRSVEVQDLSLEEVFKDLVRGQERAA